nr:hypothetical protein [Brevundimonas diminuta]
MTSLIKRAMTTPISADLLTAALDAFAEMPTEDRQSYEARAFRVFQLLEERDENGDRALSAFVIQLRLEALARLHDDRGLRAWTLPGEEEGMDYIHADVVEAAAVEPLKAIDDRTTGFDAESFRARVLASAAVRGNA